MIPAIRAEFRKLMTVRSTYVIILLCLAITIFFGFYVEGYHQSRNVTSPDKLASEITSAAQSLSLFIALAGVLLVTHEYRYNTILYSLTSAARRSYVLIAKILVVSVFAIVVTLIMSSLAPLLAELGLHAKGLNLAPQNFPVGDLLLRAALYGWGYSMLGLIFSFIIRNQVGVIALLFVVPGIVENLIRLVIKDNAQYLPFSTLDAVLRGGNPHYAHPVVTLLCYVIGGWLISWLLFARRDAN